MFRYLHENKPDSIHIIETKHSETNISKNWEYDY